MKKMATISTIDQEKALVHTVQNGTDSEKEIAFSQLMKAHKPRVLHILSTGVKFDIDTAKDLMMDVFMKVYANIQKYNPNEGAFSTWLYTITNNRLRDHKRGEKFEVLSLEELNVKTGGEEKDDSSFSFQLVDESKIGNGAVEMIKQEKNDLVHSAINSIKNDTVREVIKLRYMEDLDYDTIAAKTSLPLGSVKAYVNRGRDEMKVFIEGKMPKLSKMYERNAIISKKFENKK